jgi:hypothetical protein
MSIYYVIGQECPCCTGIDVKNTHTAMLLDPEGVPVLFESRSDASKFLHHAEVEGARIEDLMIIPEMEVL